MNYGKRNANKKQKLIKKKRATTVVIPEKPPCVEKVEKVYIPPQKEEKHVPCEMNNSPMNESSGDGIPFSAILAGLFGVAVIIVSLPDTLSILISSPIALVYLIIAVIVGAFNKANTSFSNLWKTNFTGGMILWIIMFIMMIFEPTAQDGFTHLVILLLFIPLGCVANGIMALLMSLVSTAINILKA